MKLINPVWYWRFGLALVVLSLVLATFQASATPHATPASTHVTVVPKFGPVADQPTTGSPHFISGLDLHDGTLVQDGTTYYLYGTQYACGFRWSLASPTNWCGFGVAHAASLDGPWSGITTLVSPNSIDPWNGMTWRAECTRANNAGCFNPRMMQRPDGVWILSFNSPADYAVSHANAYNFEGCEGPEGPCGPGSGPHGSYNKPAMYTCATNGDFTIFNSGPTAYIVCTMPNQTLAEEQLDAYWTNGTGNISGHGSANLSGYGSAEGPGVYFDAVNSKWIMTLSYKNCGYGSGCGTAYAWAYSPSGPWYNPGNFGFAVDSKARSTLSWNSCGGQPRTVGVVDGVAYQVIDLWVPGAWGDSTNQTGASLLLTPLVHNNQLNTPGVPWQPFASLACQ
jgi:hypothetical protein